MELPDHSPPDLDGPADWAAVIEAFIRRHVEAAGASGVVLGLSGGLDSAVVAILAARALGPERVHGYLLPAEQSDPQDAEHGLLSAQAAGIATTTVAITPVVDAAQAALAGAQLDLAGAGTTLEANLKARARMILLYAEAQRRGALVSGTGNKSELLLGYFTKHGDGGNDLQPIGDLYKTEVQALAEHLGVPRPIIDKPPSAGLWPGQTDEDELGLAYADLDRILKGFELNASCATIAERTGLDLATVLRIDGMVRRSEHKRRASLVPKLGARTVGVDWRRAVQWAGPST